MFSTMDESNPKKRKTEAIAEPPNKNPEKNISFQLKPAIKLKQSIESLNDIDLNPMCCGLLEVSEKGFEITVRNTDLEGAAKLFLNASGLINFHCNKPIVKKQIDLYRISLFLLGVADDDTITISHLDGSSTLSFKRGSDPAKELNLELEQLNEEIKKFPDIKFSCEAVLSSEVLREVIEQLEPDRDDQQVSMEISEGLLTIFVRRLLKYWKYNFIDDFSRNKIDYKGMAPGLKHHAWFRLYQWNAIRKASFLAPRLLVRYVTEPSNNIVMQFNLRDFGSLVFMVKALKITTNSNEIQRGDDTSAVASNQSN